MQPRQTAKRTSLKNFFLSLTSIDFSISIYNPNGMNESNIILKLNSLSNAKLELIINNINRILFIILFLITIFSFFIDFNSPFFIKAIADII